MRRVPWRKVIVGAGALAGLGGRGFGGWYVLVREGILRYNEYDRRERGTLKAGDPAPDLALDGLRRRAASSCRSCGGRSRSSWSSEAAPDRPSAGRSAIFIESTTSTMTGPVPHRLHQRGAPRRRVADGLEPRGRGRLQAADHLRRAPGAGEGARGPPEVPRARWPSTASRTPPTRPTRPGPSASTWSPLAAASSTRAAWAPSASSPRKPRSAWPALALASASAPAKALPERWTAGRDDGSARTCTSACCRLCSALSGPRVCGDRLRKADYRAAMREPREQDRGGRLRHP